METSIDKVFTHITDLGAIASILAALAALAASFLTSWFSFRGKLAAGSDPQATLEDQVRADELRDALKQQERVARWAGRANGLLLFGQVVIGGVLATSFVQTQLDPNVIGLFGVIVLVSSLMHQQFRPDLKSRNSRRRVSRLRQLLREAEDGIFEIQREIENAPTVEFLRRRVTEQLSRIEQTEVEELPGERRVEGMQVSGSPGATTQVIPAAQPGAPADAAGRRS